MKKRTLGRSAATLLAALTVVASPAAASASTPGGQPGRFDEYVALGDSYTSGPLIPWLRLDSLACFRSTGNYPSRLAAKIRPHRFVDASCGGADTQDMTGAQAPGTPPQLNALSERTDLVTMGIGGNDFNSFGELTSTCAALRNQNPTGSPCRDRFEADGGTELARRMTAVADRITAVVGEIRARSPHAKVVLVGYPRIIPPQGYCPDIIPFADGDYAFYDEWEQKLNGAVSQAAHRTHADFVDTYTPSLGHDACATGGAAWINGMRFSLVAAPMHPFGSAMAGEAALIADRLAGKRTSPGTLDRITSETTTREQAAMSNATPDELAHQRAGADRYAHPAR
ncbi:SGNH/GDSL hydrolase family protein [Amycolatopsis halotolerans]|uniref:SGNH/GDSL hydrolase family protein n=1 Tax=Amycolatopsis halotolerans TaxID=330083 RepID=A0ABV7QE53_9PSEU